MSKIHAKILKKVRADEHGHIRRGFGICNQVRDVCIDEDIRRTEKAKTQICNWISSSLAPFSFYTGWLSYQNFQYNSTEVYKGRYAWLDWMIENHHVFDKVKVH